MRVSQLDTLLTPLKIQLTVSKGNSFSFSIGYAMKPAMTHKKHICL